MIHRFSILFKQDMAECKWNHWSSRIIILTFLSAWVWGWNRSWSLLLLDFIYWIHSARKSFPPTSFSSLCFPGTQWILVVLILPYRFHAGLWTRSSVRVIFRAGSTFWCKPFVAQSLEQGFGIPCLGLDVSWNLTSSHLFAFPGLPKPHWW